MCEGQEVVFTCQQSGVITRWAVNLTNTTMDKSVAHRPAGTVYNFMNDPGFKFEISTLPSNSSSFISKLRVTAVRQLNGVTVECVGNNGPFMSTIQIASVGE